MASSGQSFHEQGHSREPGKQRQGRGCEKGKGMGKCFFVCVCVFSLSFTSFEDKMSNILKKNW